MAAQGTVTRNEDGTVRFETRCMLCEQPVAVDRLDPEAFAAWQAGAYVQDAFPNMSASEREALVSGSHAKCFDAAFPEEDDEEPPYEDDPDEFPEFPPGT
jgi:hypothetical protein